MFRVKKTETNYVTLHFPLLHIDTTERLQYDKVVEEYNEVRKELFSESPPEKMLHELQDIIQAYITLLCVKAKPFSVDEQEVSDRVIHLVEQANQTHRKKIERYKAERGWL
jgi:Ribonuclease G/E